MDSLFKLVQDKVMEKPSQLKLVNAFAKRLTARVQAKRVVDKVVSCQKWKELDFLVQAIDWEEALNGVDLPFFKLVKSLEENKAPYSPTMLWSWWRRMKATNQQTAIQFVNMQELLKFNFVNGDAILSCCNLTKQFLDNLRNLTQSDNAVFMVLCQRIGLVADPDCDPELVHSAWKKWAVKNHPDKGGDLESFVLAKCAYEEWRDVLNKSAELTNNKQ